MRDIPSFPKTSLRVAPVAIGVVLALAALGCGEEPDEPVAERTSALVQATITVSPTGTGTACTQAAPCSLSQAQAKVRTINANMTGDIVVNLLDGTYFLSSTWTFDASDSGTNGFFVVWQAAPNATPIISGGQQITGWTASGKPGVFQANVGTALNTRQLYVNGERMPRAGGAPPVDLTFVADFGYTEPSALMASFRNPTNIEFEFSGAAQDTGKPWTDARCPVASISGTTIHMAAPCWGNITAGAFPWFGQLGGLPTRIDNAFELLDEPGEWYLDRSTGTLFYMPPAGVNPMSSTIIAPVLETLVSAAGTLAAPLHNLRFIGLTFSHATWLRPGTPTGFAEMQANFTQTSAAGDGREGLCDPNDPTCIYAGFTKTPANVNFVSARNVALIGDTFTHLGGAGLGFELGSSDDTVLQSTFTDISGSGIQIGGADDPRPADPRVTVTNISIMQSYIHDLPAEYLGGVGIFVGYTSGVHLLANQISNTPYSGISIGWGGWARSHETLNPPVLLNASRNNVISSNHIFNVMGALSDGGFLYSNGNRGTSMADGDLYIGNHLHDQLHPGRGVYDDIASRFVTVQNQVVYNVPNSWGGCAASGDLTFEDGFWAPAASDFECTQGDESNIQALRDTPLAAPDPGADCESNPTCGSLVAAAGPPLSVDVVDGRGEIALVDDQNPNIIYSPNWTSDPNRGFNDLAHTLHYTSVNGASFQYTFVGTGIDVLNESDSNRGNVSISVDGVARPNANCATGQVIANQLCARVRGLTAGSHVLKVTKLDGDYMTVDGLRVYTAGPEGIPTDDASPTIAYAGGSWTSAVRSAYGEFANTVHFATANGASYTVSFSGTGIDLFGARDNNRGPIDVSVDGTFVERVNVFTSAPLATQQLLFRVRNLPQTTHTITAIKRGGAYMDLDRVNVRMSAVINDDNPTFVSYFGAGWFDSNSRGLGDFNDDVHFTGRDGDSVSCTFSGTGVEVIGETFTDLGAVDVVVDGIPRGRIFAFRPDVRSVQQTLFRLRGLALTTHRVLLTKRGGSYLVIDAFKLIE